MAMQAAYELCERLDAAAGTLVLSRDQADDTALSVRLEAHLQAARLEADGGAIASGIYLTPTGRRVAVIVDVSASMHGLLADMGEMLVALLRRMALWQPAPRVHLLAFADEVESCECDDGLELPADLLRAETWLRSLQLGRGTNTAAALETALALPDIGTIVLFTDGLPNTPPSSLVTRVTEARAATGVKLHAYLTGNGSSDATEDERAFLRTLASAGGGVTGDLTPSAQATSDITPPYAAVGGPAVIETTLAAHAVQEAQEAAEAEARAQTQAAQEAEEKARRDAEATARVEAEEAAAAAAQAEREAASGTQSHHKPTTEAAAFTITDSAVGESLADTNTTEAASADADLPAVATTMLFVAAPHGGFVPAAAAQGGGPAEETAVEASGPVDPTQGGYVLAIPQRSGVPLAVAGRHFPGVVAHDPTLRSDAVCVRFFTGEYDDAVAVSDTHCLTFEAFCSAVQQAVAAQDAEGSCIEAGLWPDDPSSRQPPAASHSPSAASSDYSANVALHGQPRRRLSKSQSKAAQEAQARRVHEMAILEETTRREAQQPLRREQRAARDAQAESKRLQKTAQTHANLTHRGAQASQAEKRLLAQQQAAQDKYSAVLRTMRRERVLRRQTEAERAAMHGEQDSARVSLARQREQARRQELQAERTRVAAEQRQAEAAVTRFRIAHRTAAAAAEDVYDSEVALADRLRRQVTISRRTAEAERNASEVDTVTQRLHLKRGKQMIRLERDSERAEMAQLGEQSSVVALQRAREIREASMPSDTLERGTLLPQERLSANGALHRSMEQQRRVQRMDAREHASAAADSTETLRRQRVDERHQREEARREDRVAKERARREHGVNVHRTVRLQNEARDAEKLRQQTLARTLQLEKLKAEYDARPQREKMQAEQQEAAIEARRETRARREERAVDQQRKRQAQEAQADWQKRAEQARGLGNRIAPGYLVLSADPRGVV